MQGAERREVVQATPATGVADRAAMPGVQMRSAKTPMAAEEVGRGAATLSMLAEKAQPAVQALHMQNMREDYLKGQMQFSQGKTYQQIRESGASYATVSGAAALQAQKAMNDAYIEGLSSIEKGDHMLTPEQYTEKLGSMSKSLFTGDQIVDNFMTELVTPNVQKLAAAQIKAHEKWKVAETKSAQKDVFTSLANMQDEDSDKLLSSMLGVKQGDTWVYEGPIQGLNPEDRKSCILEATVLGLEEGNPKILQKLGGLNGIRARFSTTAAEDSAITKAFDSFQSKKEKEFNADLESALMQNERAVRTGAITYEQGMANGQEIAKVFGKGNKTLLAMASDLHGAANAHMNSVEADRRAAIERAERRLEKAQEDYMKVFAVQAAAAEAIGKNQLYSLDSKEASAAWQLIARDIDAKLVADVKEGKVGTDEISKTAHTRMATAIDQYGVVNEDLANHITAAFNTNLVSNEEGKVYEGVQDAYESLAPLYHINPNLALKHLKTEGAKAMFVMAAEMDLDPSFGTGEALKRAALNMRKEVSPDLIAGRITPDVKVELQTGVKDAVVNMAPSLNPFTTTKRGSVLEVSTWEMERAATDPVLLEQLERKAKTTWFKQPTLTASQVVSLTTADVLGKGAYMLGTIVLPEGDDNVHKILGMPEYSRESGAPHEALVEWLKVNGEAKFGKQWFDSEIASRGDGAFMGYLGTQAQSLYRDAPEMYVTMNKGRDGYTLTLNPVLNDGSVGTGYKLKARELGDFYRKYRAEHIDDAPKVTRDNFIDPLNNM